MTARAMEQEVAHGKEGETSQLRRPFAAHAAQCIQRRGQRSRGRGRHGSFIASPRPRVQRAKSASRGRWKTLDFGLVWSDVMVSRNVKFLRFTARPAVAGI